jgi:hypothetical protein
MSSGEPVQTIKSVKFIYTGLDRIEPIAVNSIYGGVTPRGELLCHFLYEYPELPTMETVPLVAGEVQRDKAVRSFPTERGPDEAVLRRDIKVSLVIPIQQVNSIATWMLDKLKQIETLKATEGT